MKTLLFTLMFCAFEWSFSENVILAVQRVVKKQGFHRDIETTVSIQTDDLVWTPNRQCGMLLIETLPSGLYVDKFQLDNMIAFGGPQVLINEAIDIEAPKYLSKEHTLFVFIPIPSTKASQDEIQITVTLPVHARYHRPSPDPAVTHREITMYHPRVLLNCSRTFTRTTRAPCDVHNSSWCSWTEMVYKSDGHFVKLEVPVGMESDTGIVVLGTILVTVVGCSFLLYIITSYKDKMR